MAQQTKILPSNTEGQPGIPIDFRGQATVDPTKNVGDLVRALEVSQSNALEALKELLNEKVGNLKETVKLISDNHTTFQNAQLASETRRINELASTRQEFSNTIRDMLAESVRTTSNLVSTQLVQIQATFDTRVTKLEAGAFTQAGKSSVQDPATADALSRMATGIASLSTTTTEAMNKTSTATADAIATLTKTLGAMQSGESRISGSEMGRAGANARLLVIIATCATVLTPIVSAVGAYMVIRGH
jgi:hypothetical protein